jgi:hypothetical protein
VKIKGSLAGGAKIGPTRSGGGRAGSLSGSHGLDLCEEGVPNSDPALDWRLSTYCRLAWDLNGIEQGEYGMGVPKSESPDELHMAAANGSMDRISADVKAPSREAGPENAPRPEGIPKSEVIVLGPR